MDLNSTENREIKETAQPSRKPFESLSKLAYGDGGLPAEQSFVIYGQPRPKKNSQKICMTRDGRRFVAQSDRYAQYEKDCIVQLQPHRHLAGELGEPPYNVRCIFYREDRRKCDLVNLLEAADDILVRAGILPDDNYTIICGHDGSRVYYDKNNPRVEITITQIGENS